MAGATSDVGTVPAMMINASRARRAATTVLGVLAAACGGEGAPPAPVVPPPDAGAAARAYLDSAITVMQNVAFYRARVDWPTVRAGARTMAAGATTPAGTYPAIRFALAALGDRHSFLQPPVAGAATGPDAGAQVVLPGAVGARAVPAGAPPADSLDGEIVGGRYGYLRVPTFAVPLGTPDAAARITAMADTLQALVRAVDAQGPCGWVVDLRHNRGGNMWPMLVGVAPILGEGPYGAFVDASGGSVQWYYADGAAGTLSASGVRSVAARTSRPPYALRRPDPPVAVLTDSLTASSGEAIAVAFRGRPAARSFGGATTGVPTANAGYRLPDGAFLLIMVSVDADRTGRRYDTRIPPDVPVPQTAAPATDDATVVAATGWLATRPECAAGASPAPSARHD
jgi:carboxyl-terminal processing protease